MSTSIYYVTPRNVTLQQEILRAPDSFDPPKTCILTLRTLMSTTVHILRFYWHMYNQLLKIKYASNLETLIYVGTQISQITQIFSHLKLWIAVARHNFKWMKI